MKVLHPLLLKDKLIDAIDHGRYTIGFSPELKEKVLQKCLDLWLYILNAQEVQWAKNPSLREKLKKMNLSPYDEPASISSEALSRRFRIHRFLYYNHLLDILKEIGAVTIDDWYKVGEQSKSYSIKTDLLKGFYGNIIWDEPNNPIDNHKYRTKQEWIKEYPDHRTLIENHYKCNINLFTLERELCDLKTLGEINEKQYYFYLNLSLKFNGRYIWFSRNGGGRFYSSFTSLPKIVRKHITLDGDFVCEIDLKNALPLFISYKVDDMSFRKDCLEGVFWDKISKHTNIERDIVKTKFFTDITYNQTLRRTKLYLGLEELYPGLYNKIEELKSRGNIHEKYTDLESKIFVDGMKGFEFPYLSIHDCLVVRNRERDRNRAVQALKYIFVDKGLEIPTFGIKYL